MLPYTLFPTNHTHSVYHLKMRNIPHLDQNSSNKPKINQNCSRKYTTSESPVVSLAIYFCYVQPNILSSSFVSFFRLDQKLLFLIEGCNFRMLLQFCSPRWCLMSYTADKIINLLMTHQPITLHIHSNPDIAPLSIHSNLWWYVEGSGEAKCFIVGNFCS